MEEKFLPVIAKLEELTQEFSLDLVRTEDFASKYEDLASFVEELNNIKSEIDTKIKFALQEEYMKTGEQTITNEKYNFTFVPGGFRESIDSKKLKSENPDIYTKYAKTTQVSPSIRVTKRKEKEEQQ